MAPYAQFAGEGKPSYIIIVRQGVIDKGADIGPISFYPYEREILFGPLVMMECIDVSIQGAVIVLDVRLNVNALSGTLDDIMNEKSRSVANSAEMFLHELQVKDSVKKLAGASRVDELQRVEHKLKQVLQDAPRAFNDPESFQQANALAVETYKGADSHADLCARMEALLEDDAGDATLEGAVAERLAQLAELPANCGSCAEPVLTADHCCRQCSCPIHRQCAASPGMCSACAQMLYLWPSKPGVVGAAVW